MNNRLRESILARWPCATFIVEPQDAAWVIVASRSQADDAQLLLARATINNEKTALVLVTADATDNSIQMYEVSKNGTIREKRRPVSRSALRADIR